MSGGPENSFDQDDFNDLSATREDPEYDPYLNEDFGKSVEQRAAERRTDELRASLISMTRRQAGDNDAEIDKQLQETWTQLDQDEQYINEQVNDDAINQ